MLTSLLNGRMMADRHGSESPSIVALHGWARDSSDWIATLRGHDALALDLPGFGNTPAPAGPIGSPEYADVVIEALDDLAANPGAAPVILMGHSFGGRVGIHVAARRPDLVAGLILTGVPLYRRGGARAKSPATFRAAKALNRRGLISDAVMDRMRDRYGSPDYRATSGVMRSVFVTVVNETYDAPVATVAASDIPVRLVWGERDTEAPVSVANQIHEKIEHSHLTVVPGSGHLIDAALSDALRTAVADCKSSSARR